MAVSSECSEASGTTIRSTHHVVRGTTPGQCSYSHHAVVNSLCHYSGSHTVLCHLRAGSETATSATVGNARRAPISRRQFWRRPPLRCGSARPSPLSQCTWRRGAVRLYARAWMWTWVCECVCRWSACISAAVSLPIGLRWEASQC